jgi:diguanylate cyclase (GGDEF)-like protein
MEEMVELGLRKAGSVPPTSHSPATGSTFEWLVERLTVVLADSAPEAEASQMASFRAKLDEYRQAFRAAAGAAESGAIARHCADLCDHYLRGSRKYVSAREAELREMIGILREAAASMAGEGAAFNAQVISSSERFSALVKLDDIRVLRQQLTEEVSTLKQAVEQRRRRDEEQNSKLTRKLESLQSRLVKAEEEATHDTLTRVANRAGFDRMIHQMVATARAARAPLSLAMLDLDHFKAINDAHGHPIGDRVLLCAAMWLTKGLRHSDFVARYGGEEFAVIMHGARLGEVEKRLTTLLADIAGKSFEYEAEGQTRSVRFTLSGGATELTSGDTIEDLVRRADEALYEAKRRGRNRVVTRKRSLMSGLLGRA